MPAVKTRKSAKARKSKSAGAKMKISAKDAKKAGVDLNDTEVRLALAALQRTRKRYAKALVELAR